MTDDAARLLSADLLMTLLLGVAFAALLAVHRRDLRHRRRRVAALRAAADFGPHSAAVVGVIEASESLDSNAAARLSVERRRAFEWDPRLGKTPKPARLARDRAFANERDVVTWAAADAARDAAAAALAGAAVEPRVRREAAECAAETAAAIAAADRMPAAEFRMLTRAWRTVVGQIGVAPRREQ